MEARSVHTRNHIEDSRRVSRNLAVAKKVENERQPGKGIFWGADNYAYGKP